MSLSSDAAADAQRFGGRSRSLAAPFCASVDDVQTGEMLVVADDDDAAPKGFSAAVVRSTSISIRQQLLMEKATEFCCSMTADPLLHHPLNDRPTEGQRRRLHLSGDDDSAEKCVWRRERRGRVVLGESSD